MKELLIKKQKYVQFQEQLTSYEKDPSSVEKLSFHYCANSRIVIDDNFPNLKYIEIIGCTYFELYIEFSITSKIELVFIAATKYMDIYNIKGDYPNFFRLMFDKCRFIKFKGEIDGNIALRQILIENSDNMVLFQGRTILNNLRVLKFLNKCHFTKINLSNFSAPKLDTLWFKNSNYLNIESLGSLEGQLQSFKFDNCFYPKLNVDFSKLLNLNKYQKSDEDIEKIYDKEDKMFPFRKFKIKRDKKSNKYIGKLNGNTDNLEDKINQTTKNDLDDIENPIIEYSSNDFLNALEKDKDEEFKFCPECGQSNSQNAVFCSSCGNELRN